MEGRRAPQGLDAEDRIALGLTAPRLLYLLLFSMSGWGFISSQLPLVIRVPPGLALLATGAAMAWGRIAGRPLDRWVVLYAAYLARPHRSAPPKAVSPEPKILPVASAPGEQVARPEEPGVILQLPDPRSRRPRRARRVAFFSLRGGTGKSTLASELAAGIAAGVLDDRRSPPPRAALLDLDLRASSLCISMGLDGPTLADVAAAPEIDSAVMERSLLRHESGARVMLAPPRVTDEAGYLDAVARVLAYLDEQEFDVVIIDAGRGIDGFNTHLLQAVDDIYYVFSATAPGVYDLYRGVETLRRLGHRDRIRYVANRCEPGCDLGEVLGDLRGTLAASIPVNAAFVEAADGHGAAVLDNLATAHALRPLARAALGEGVTSYQQVHADARLGQAVAARR